MKKEFVHVIQKNQGLIKRVCRVYRDNEQDREDLFQDIVLELWRSFPSFKYNSKISTWLYRIALNTAIAKYRKKSGKIQYEKLGDEHQNLSVSQKDFDDKEPIELLYMAINRLSQVEKAITLLYLEGHSYQEMSGIVGISESNISVKLTRIRKKLKDYIKPIENEGNRHTGYMAAG